eukprot:gene1134-4354_t
MDDELHNVDAKNLLAFSANSLEEQPNTILSRRQRRRKELRRRTAEETTSEEIAPRTAKSWTAPNPYSSWRLPIKVNKRLVAITTESPPEANNGNEKKDSPKQEDVVSDTEEIEPVPAKKRNAASSTDDEHLMSLSPSALLSFRKNEIAYVCSSVLESPETHIGALEKIIQLCRCSDPAIKFAVRKLAIASLASVFKDIVPGYFIRSLTQKEKGQRVSKEVKQIREFEQTLLSVYQMYLQRLHACVKDFNRRCKLYHERSGRRRPLQETIESKEMKRIASTTLLATQCMCDLLVSAPHFNFRNNIITVICPLMTGQCGSQLAKLAIDTAITVFKEDNSYDISLALVKAMAQEIKALSYNVNPEMVRAFRFVKIKERHVKAKKRDAQQEVRQRVRDKYSKNKNKRGKLLAQGTRRTRKDLKAEKEMAKELMATETEANTKKIDHCQTQILTVVFAVFFRVLKHARHSPILPAVLEGLGFFAHLIDVAVFFDLLEVLKEVISNNELSPVVRLTAVSTSITLLSEEHSFATTDPTHFIQELFKQTKETFMLPELFRHVLSSVYLLIIRRKEVSVERVGGIIKQLLHVSLHLPHHWLVPAQALIRDIIRKYPRISPMLDNDIVANGVYQPEAQLPEHTNALSTALWESAILHRHYHPLVKMYNTHLLSSAPVTGPGRLPSEHMRRTYKDYISEMVPTQNQWPFFPSMETLYLQRPKIKQPSNLVHWPSTSEAPALGDVDFAKASLTESTITKPLDGDVTEPLSLRSTATMNVIPPTVTIMNGDSDLYTRNSSRPQQMKLSSLQTKHINMLKRHMKDFRKKRKLKQKRAIQS